MLTVVTQIGGVCLLISSLICWYAKLNRVIASIVVFLVVYAAGSAATMAIAPVFGRVPLSCFGDGHHYKVATPLFCALNRQYVVPEAAVLVDALANAVDEKFPGSELLVLDANFPFLEGFPLLPHLSHHDGRKVDLAYFYQVDGEYAPAHMPSPIGYWAFERPADGASLPCAGRDDQITMRWNLQSLQQFWSDGSIEPERTRYMLTWMEANAAKYKVKKVLLEPHLEALLGLDSNLIRFQGCRAARHDDHVHIEVGDKPE